MGDGFQQRRQKSRSAPVLGRSNARRVAKSRKPGFFPREDIAAPEDGRTPGEFCNRVSNFPFPPGVFAALRLGVKQLGPQPHGYGPEPKLEQKIFSNNASLLRIPQWPDIQPDRPVENLKDDVAMPKLIFIGEHFAGRVYELTLEKTTVGRGDGNILAIHEPSVSLAHCEILVHGPEVIVRDLGSSNGTFVNRVRLEHRQAQLKSGQVVRFGSVEARLELDPADDEYGASEITAVHEHARLLRDQRREQSHPKAADPTMTLADGATGAGGS